MEHLRYHGPNWSLREIKPEDASRLAQFLNDRELYNNTLLIPYPYSRADAFEFIQLNRELEKSHGMHFNWMITDGADQVIGGIGLLYEHGISSHKSGMGYWLGAPFRQKGIMTQVVQAFCAMVFANTNLDRVEAMVYTHNPASARVLEKNGFTKEGLIRHAYIKDGKYIDAWQFARLKRDPNPID